MHMAISAVVNALWDLKAKRAGLPLWQLLASMSPEELVALVDFRYLTDALTPDEALAILRGPGAGRAERARDLLADGYPAYTTSPGWLGYDDDKLRRLCREAVAEGFTQIKLKVGADLEDDIRRMRIARERCGPDIRIAVDANQRWDVAVAVEWIARAGPVRPVVGGGADQPGRRASGHAAIARRHRADPGGHRRARAEPGGLQAAAAARRDVVSSSSTRPGWPGSTRTWRSCCWPPSSGCRSARTPAASGCASWSSTCPCSTTSRSPARWTTGSSSTSTTCTSTSLDPVRIRAGRYLAPRTRLQFDDAPAEPVRLRLPGRAGVEGRGVMTKNLPPR